MTLFAQLPHVIEAKQQFLERRGKDLKKCSCCGEMKTIAENFSLKTKQFYILNGVRRERKTPSVEATARCNPCERKRQIDGIRYKVANDPEYAARYYARFKKLEEVKRLNPDIQRRANRKYRANNKHKHLAHLIANLVHPDVQPCAVSGCLGKAERHHPDHFKPTEIIWLCRQHHKKLHAEEKYAPYRS